MMFPDSQRNRGTMSKLRHATLLATAFLGLAAVFPLALGGVATAGARTAATLLARESLESARQTAYDRLAGTIVIRAARDGSRERPSTR